LNPGYGGAFPVVFEALKDQSCPSNHNRGFRHVELAPITTAARPSNLVLCLEYCGDARACSVWWAFPSF